MKAYSDREFFEILDNNGYRHLRTNGSHKIYSNGDKTITVNRRINKMVAQRLIKTYGLEVR